MSTSNVIYSLKRIYYYITIVSSVRCSGTVNIKGSVLKTSKAGLIELVGHEGVTTKKYRDSKGVWTIGIGATGTEVPNITSLPLAHEITIEGAFNLFKKSIVKYEQAVNKALKVNISQNIFDSLVSWCYNVGIGWPKRSTIVRLLNNGVTDNRKLHRALMLFKKPPEIRKRRRREANLLTTGLYFHKGKATLWVVRKGRKTGKGKTITVSDFL